MSQAVEIKRRVPRRGVNAIVDSELHIREQGTPCRSIARAMTSEDVLDNAINAFGLPIRLRMIGSRHIQASALESKDFAPEVRGKPRVAVANDGLRESVMAKDMLEKHPSSDFRRYGRSHRSKVNHLA